MKRTVWLFFVVIVAAGSFMGCFSFGEPQPSPSLTVSPPQAQTQPQPQPQEKSESQLEKYLRLIEEDAEKLAAERDKGTLTIESIEAVLQPQVISGIGEITNTKLSEPGRPYWFKLRAIYKGYDASAKRARLQDLGQKQSNVMDSVLGAAFGVDTDIYSVGYSESDVSRFPMEANAIATFYLYAARITEVEGRQTNETVISCLFVRDIEPSPFDPEKFIVASGMHYITVEDAHSPTQEDVMTAYFFGSASRNSTSGVFDPIAYPLVDLMDARVAMDKKDIRDDYTFAEVRVKYVSELIFKGQSNTTITVSTDDNVLTERMNFTGRASTIKNGDRIRVYYTITKDPLEKWEIQAIERL